MAEFLDFGKIKSLKDGEELLLDFKNVVATEKVDGCCSALRLVPSRSEHEFVVQSRSCIIGPNERVKDNHGFYQWAIIQEKHLRETYTNLEISIFGEWYGAGIQNRIKYSDEKRFIVFDVNVAGFWLDWHNVEDVASRLGYDVVPTVHQGPFGREAFKPFIDCESVVAKRNGFPGQPAEGIVCRPLHTYFNNQGSRVFLKYKNKMFAENTSEQGGKEKPKIEGLDDFVSEVCTEERLNHVLGHLGDNPNIGAILKEMSKDVQEECQEWQQIGVDWRVISKAITEKTKTYLKEMGMI